MNSVVTTQAESGDVTSAVANRTTSVSCFPQDEVATVVEPSPPDELPVATGSNVAVMVDLETMSQRPTAAIASIGACLFDPHSDWIGPCFHIHVSLENCLRHGLSIDASTILWWMERDDDARHTLVVGQIDAAPLITALEAFTAFCHSGRIYIEPEIWCNGNSFDLPILANAYHAIGAETPWHYWNERDLRTLKGINKGARLERTGTHHNALDDALHQARLVQHILQYNPDMDA